MASFKDLSSLFAYVKTQIDESLQDDVAKTVKDTEIAQIDEKVYSSYSPIEYGRRGSSGGLGDKSNIVSTLEGVGELSVKNKTPSSPSTIHGGVSDNLADWVNDGAVNNIFSDYHYVWNDKRDFQQGTIEEIASSQKHKNALKNGLNKRNIKTN